MGGVGKQEEKEEEEEDGEVFAPVLLRYTNFTGPFSPCSPRVKPFQLRRGEQGGKETEVAASVSLDHPWE